MVIFCCCSTCQYSEIVARLFQCLVIIILCEIWLYNLCFFDITYSVLSNVIVITHIPSSFFSYKKKIGKIHYLLLSGKTFHFPDAGSSGNIIDLLLKFFKVIMLSYILHSWSNCHHYLCISITTYICPFSFREEKQNDANPLQVSHTFEFLYVKSQIVKN